MFGAKTHISHTLTFVDCFAHNIFYICPIELKFVVLDSRPNKI